jgi:serine/threonine-protein kinase
MIAYVAASAGQAPRLLLRRLDASEEQVVGDAIDVRHPFFSPDGRWLGFFAGDTIRKVSLADGRSEVIGHAPRGESASWDHGVIVFGEAGDLPGAGIRRMREEGGQAEVLSMPDRDAGEINHLKPQLLPDGSTLIYSVRSAYVSSGAASRIMIERPGSPVRTLIDDAQFARYIGNGLLVYQRNRSLMATTLDLDSLTTNGPGVTLFDDVSPTEPSWAAAGGLLVYRSRNDNRRLVWVGRDGHEVSLPAPPKRYAAPSLSPRGDRLAVEIEDAGFDIWVLEIERGTLSKLTSDGASRYPMWTPDGRHVGIVHRRDNALFWKSPDDGVTKELVREKFPIWIGSWSRDMRTLVYMLESPTTGSDLWALDLGAAARALVRTPAREYGGRLSPGGQWVAYFSNETGQFELYLKPFAREGPRYKISTTIERTLVRAREAVWSRDGRELFYRHGPQMMSVRVSSNDREAPGPATILFEGDYFSTGGPGIVNYDVAADGRFLMLKAIEERTPHLSVVQGIDRLIRERLNP